MTPKVLADDAEGVLTHVGNELLNDSKVDDPSAYRGGAPATQRSLVKFSGDIVEAGRREEVVLLQFKQTENAQNHVSGRGGELYIGLAKKDAPSSDENMIDVLSATVEHGFVFKVPVYAPNLGASARPDCMWSPNGMYVTQQQDDGNFVTYRCAVPFDKFSGATAIWSAWSGPIT